MATHSKEEDGYLRLWQIIGKPANPKAKSPTPSIPALIPIGASTWWDWVKSGKAPKPIKLSPKVTVWRRSEVMELVERSAAQK